MPHDLVTLVSFDRATADAVSVVLRRHGVSVETSDSGEEATLHVPPAQRDAAFAVLARHMEEVQAELARQRAHDRPAWDGGWADQGRDGAADSDSAEEPRPLVMERFRSLGAALAILVIPLMVVTLASAGVPGVVKVTLFLLLAGLLALYVLRRR